MKRLIWILLLAAAPLAAQEQPIRFGVDGQVGIQSANDTSYVFTNLPISILRISFPLGRRFALQPILGLHAWSGGGMSEVGLNAGLDGQVYVSDRVYVAVGTGVGYMSEDDGTNSVSGSQVSLAGALGTNVPLTDFLEFRLEGRLSHGFENDTFVSSTAVLARFGLSVRL